MKVIRNFLVAVTILLGAWIVTVKTIDPRGDFQTGLFPVVVRDSRVIKMGLFTNRNVAESTQGVVLGSSRAMKLAPQELQKAFGLRFFNFSVDSGRAEDYLAIYRWMRRKGASPRLIIIGLDLEALHDNDIPDSRFSQNEELNNALYGRQGGGVAKMQAYKESITVGYLLDIVRSIRQFIRPRALLSDFENDGFLRYLDWEHKRALGQFDFHARDPECFPEYVGRFQDMRKLSPKRSHLFEETIGDAQSDGARVIVWLTPVHPDTAKLLAAKTEYNKLLSEARNYLSELSRRTGIRVYDLSEISRFHGTLDGWYDCGHTDETNSSLIVSMLAGDESYMPKRGTR